MLSLESPTPLPPMVPNIATMLRENARKWHDKDFLFEWKENRFVGMSWGDAYQKIKTITANLARHGYRKGDKVLIYSPNRPEMLLLELAVMASGGISVPIFGYYPQNVATDLFLFSEARFIAVAGQLQLGRLSPELPYDKIILFDSDLKTDYPNHLHFSSLLHHVEGEHVLLDFDIPAEEICLNMFTSGTTGRPKCVQLSHQNILSQQAGLDPLWDLGPTDRFLSYLPWHHSFGGIFELFTALYRGVEMYLEPSLGKDMNSLFRSWIQVKPTAFFSVPKVYQALVDNLSTQDKIREFFHPDLKFIFTAAASLPENTARWFLERGVKIYEGWGLTETSPCCTISDPSIPREPGVVGRPIPGVSIRITDAGEIEVKGPNVMKGYFNFAEANELAFTSDGWFRTGDLGAITPEGCLKLVGRSDSVFKLLNGEKVNANELQAVFQNKCHYLSFAVVHGSGKPYPIALLFPNKTLLNEPDYFKSPMDGCLCPRSLEELARCLNGCMNQANCGIGPRFQRIKYALLVDGEPSLENGTLTPSMKISEKVISEVYKAEIQGLYGEGTDSKTVYLIPMENTDKP